VLEFCRLGIWKDEIERPAAKMLDKRNAIGDVKANARIVAEITASDLYHSLVGSTVSASLLI
jgi:hypothetical protein